MGRVFRLPPSPFRGEHGGPSRTRSRSIWRWQLFLAFSVVTVAAVIAVLDPVIFTDAPFTAGAGMLIAITLLSMAAPWDRVDARWAFAIPALDIVAIGLMAASEQVRLGFLWVFPIAWVATYYTLPWLIAALGTVSAMLLITTLPHEITVFQTVRLLVVLICLGFIGATISLGARRAKAAQRLLRRQSHHLQRALDRSRVQEQQSVQLLDALHSGVARVGPDGTIRSANLAYRRLYGVDGVPQHHPTRSVEYRARRGEPIPPEQTTAARAARGESFSGVRIWLFDAGGRWRAVEASTSSVADGPGAGGSVLIISDVTAQADAALERHSVARTLSHELRNPLTAVVGHADLLMERSDLPADAHRQLTVIENAADRMQRLVSSFLEDSAPSGDDPKAPFDLAAVVSASAHAFAPAAAAEGVKLEYAEETALPLVGDAFRLRQVVDNVIGNGIKYTPRGGSVVVSQRLLDDDEVEVTVTDTGIGISALDLPRVFERHFRADSARSSGLPGSGLGMTISRDIVREHGGSLDVSSDLGRGTTVKIHLPRHTRQEAA